MDLESEYGLKIFPTPTKEVLQFSWETAEVSRIQVTIMNMSGKVVLERMVRKGEVIELKGLQSGVYLVEISTESGNFQRRIVLE